MLPKIPRIFPYESELHDTEILKVNMPIIIKIIARIMLKILLPCCLLLKSHMNIYLIQVKEHNIHMVLSLMIKMKRYSC